MACTLHSTLRIWEQPASLTLLLKAGRQAAFHVQRSEDRGLGRGSGAHTTPTGLQRQPLLVAHVPQTQPREKDGLKESSPLAQHLTY